MAEKGIVVSDASSGESVACRDGYEQDDQSNSRVVQLVDQASRHTTLTYATPFRTIDLGSSSYWDWGSDGNTNQSFDSLNSSVSESLTVGDGNLLIVGAMCELRSNLNIDGSKALTIFPAILDSADAILGVLRPKTLPIIKSISGSYANRCLYKGTRNVGGNDYYEVIFPVISWHIEGAPKIKIFVRADLGGNGQYLQQGKLFADIVSAPTAEGSHLAYNTYTTLGASGDGA